MSQTKRNWIAALILGLITSTFSTVVVTFADSGWMSAQEMAERVASRRRIRVVYSRDFTAVAGGRRVHVFVAD